MASYLLLMILTIVPIIFNAQLKKSLISLLNDIWWYQIEVAKAMYRDEVTLVSSIYEEMLLERVTTLLSWKIGLKYEWKIDLGRKKRWLKRYLPESIYNDYLHLYPNKCYNSIWDRLFSWGHLFKNSD